MADAKAIPDSVMAMERGSRSPAASKAAFTTAVLKAIAPTDAERAALMTADGKLSIDGQTRVERAVLARAFDDPDLISLLTEGSDENGLRSIGGALLDVAPLWARMRAEARAGRIPAELDITSQLLDAIYLIRKARQRGESGVAIVEWLQDAIELQHLRADEETIPKPLQEMIDKPLAPVEKAELNEISV